MDLLIFDIDGTLIHSHEDEVTCFVKAYTQVMGKSDINTDLQSYEHVTDTGIAKECIFKQFMREATEDELLAIEENFLTLFDQSLSINPPKVIKGIHDLLASLSNQENLCLAIATGSYYRSALLKLNHAALGLAHLPLSSCDDHIARIEIMKHANNRAKDHYAIDNFRSITYVGDGPWDIQACAKLDWNFIGIASNYSALQLKTWGAKSVINDYQQPLGSFLELILNK
ncbi:MAG: HAD family hydrolase [Proteobacteria bacterium]|nr:HAD family hydrolase [Pseudomonadota bacterium]